MSESVLWVCFLFVPFLLIQVYEMQHGINNTKIKNCSYQENVHSIIVKILQMSELSIIHAACQVCLHYVVHYSTMDFFFFFYNYESCH